MIRSYVYAVCPASNSFVFRLPVGIAPRKAFWPLVARLAERTGLQDGPMSAVTDEVVRLSRGDADPDERTHGQHPLSEG